MSTRYTDEVTNQDDDKIGYERELQGFYQLLQSTNGPYVLAISAPWGSGKTSFINMLASSIEGLEEFNCLRINAWESDYSSDPLIAIISDLTKQLAEKPGFEEFDFTKLKKLAINISKSAIPIILKIITSGLLDTEKFKDWGDLSEVVTTNLIKDFDSKKDSVESLKEELRQFVSILSPKKVIIFVDELDRCRPNYAIEFLESIKHLFEIEGYIFVLSIEKEELSKSLKVIYGNEFDSLGYLKRFIDFDYQLEEKISQNFIEHVLKKYKVHDVINNSERMKAKTDFDSIVDVFYVLALNFNLKPRDVTQIASRFLLTITYNKDLIEHTLADIALLAYLLIKKFKSQTEFEQLFHISSPSKLLKEDGFYKLMNILDGHLRGVAIIVGTIVVATQKSKGSNEFLLSSFQDQISGALHLPKGKNYQAIVGFISNHRHTIHEDTLSFNAELVNNISNFK